MLVEFKNEDRIFETLKVAVCRGNAKICRDLQKQRGRILSVDSADLIKSMVGVNCFQKRGRKNNRRTYAMRLGRLVMIDFLGF